MKRERDLDWEKISVKRTEKMPENKATVCRTSSYLSHPAYRKIKQVLSFRRREYLRPTETHRHTDRAVV